MLGLTRGGGVTFGDMPGDSVNAGAGIPLQGTHGGVAGAGQQHRGGGAALGVVRQGAELYPLWAGAEGARMVTL